MLLSFVTREYRLIEALSSNINWLKPEWKFRGVSTLCCIEKQSWKNKDFEPQIPNTLFQPPVQRMITFCLSLGIKVHLFGQRCFTNSHLRVASLEAFELCKSAHTIFSEAESKMNHFIQWSVHTWVATAILWLHQAPSQLVVYYTLYIILQPSTARASFLLNLGWENAQFQHLIAQDIAPLEGTQSQIH